MGAEARRQELDVAATAGEKVAMRPSDRWAARSAPASRGPRGSILERPPALADVARIVAAASRVLRIADVDERISVENAAIMAFAKQRGLVG